MAQLASVAMMEMEQAATVRLPSYLTTGPEYH